MIRINLISAELLSVTDNGQHQVLCKARLGPAPVLAFPGLLDLKPPSLSPALMERLLGKSPLRLIADRKLVSKGCFEETLVCGHTLTTFTEFLWDDKAHLVELPFTARRRRCRECKAAQEAGESPIVNELPGSSPKKPSHSVKPRKEDVA